jgi:small multidrug resistance pump
MPVGIAYGVRAACGVALTALGARVFFNEALTRRMAAGVGLIAAGVLIINLGAAAH